jgi:tetratricopeptide (TPR) repeat protein/tRNA A-37 threonylcarbamoyl transferase component Bud32
MKKTIMCLTAIFIIILSVVLIAEKDIDREIADLEKKLEQVSGKEKINALNELAEKHYSLNPKRVLEYANQALKLSQTINDRKGEAEALKNIGNGNWLLGDANKALEYGEKALKIFEEIKDKKGTAIAFGNIGNAYIYLSQYDKTIDYYSKAMKIFKETGDKENMAKYLNNIGSLYYSLNDYKKALECYLEGLNLQEEVGVKKELALLLGNIGLVYSRLENYKKALDYYRRTLQLHKESGNKSGTAHVLSNIGTVYLASEDFDRSLEFYLEALKIEEELGDKQGISKNLRDLGDVYYYMGNLDKSLQYHQDALKIMEKTEDKRNSIYSLIGIAVVYKDRRNYDKALAYLKKSLTLAKEVNVKDPIKECYHSLTDLYTEMGDYKEALEYHKLFYKLDKEIVNETSNKQINELQAKYDAEKRTKDILALKKNNEIQQLKLSREKITRYGLIIGLILVLIIFGLVFKKYLYLFAFWKKQKHIGRFRLMDKIASGGMGTIFKAHSIHDKSDFAAIKVLRDELFSDTTNKKRFKREAAIIDKLEHPNIIKIFERGESKQTLFIAMEYLEGKTLEHKIDEEGPLRLEESLDIMVQISDALAFIHSKNIIHRDLKPANIMLIEKDGNPNFVKLLDFGLARMELETRLTQSGNLIGTLQYLAPEQVLDAHSAPTNDIFSMGVICYYILSGENPFAGETAIDIMRQIIIKEPVRVSELRPGIPGELDELVMQMINKEPGERPSAESIQDKFLSLREKKVT